MSKEYTIEIRVDGEKQEVTLSQPQGLEFLHAVATMPDSFEQEEPDDMEMSPEDVDWIQVMLERTTDLTRDELVYDVSVEDMHKLIESAALVFAGEEPTTSTDSFRLQKSDDPFEGLDLNDDGSVDPDDWR